MSIPQDTKIELGRISGLHGAQGWLKVFSYTKPRAEILNYSAWIVSQRDIARTFHLLSGKEQGKNILAQLKGIHTREDATLLVESTIEVELSQLRPLKKGQYYFAQLVGLEVVNIQGCNFGVIEDLIQTGSNDVLVVKGGSEILIPYIASQVIKDVDLKNRKMLVDWDLEDE